MNIPDRFDPQEDAEIHGFPRSSSFPSGPPHHGVGHYPRSATTPEARHQQVEAPDIPLADRAVAALESGKRLEVAME